MSKPNMVHRTTAPAAAVVGQAGPEVALPPASKPAATAKHLIEVDAVLFRAANHCRSDEEVRYYLNGVYVHPHPEKGVLLVGTDGHRMLVAHDEDGVCSQPAIVTIATKALAGVKAPSKPQGARPRLVVQEDKHVVLGSYRSLTPALIDGTYPNYVLVLKPLLEALRKNQFLPASFKAEYIREFGKVAEILKPGDQAIRIVTTSESDAALILFSGDMRAFGVLMPMCKAIVNGFPRFMQPVLEPPPPAAKAKKAKAKPRVATKPKQAAKKRTRSKKGKR